VPYLRNDSLPTAEGPGNGGGSALDTWKEGVQDALAGQEGTVAGQLVLHRTTLAHRPNLEHGVPRDLVFELRFHDHVVHAVVSRRSQPLDPPVASGREHQPVIVHHAVLENRSVYVPAGHQIVDLELGGGKRVRDVPRQGRDIDALGYVDGVGQLADRPQGSLDAIEDAAHDPGAQFHGQRLAGLVDGVSDTHARSVLVHLDGGHVALQTDDLAHQLVVSHADQLVHG